MTAPGRVLVVDDNQMNRALLKERLVRQALYVEEASDGHDALRKLAAKPFDLVLLDEQRDGAAHAGLVEGRLDAAVRGNALGDADATAPGREKNRRTDIKVYANPSS